MSIGQHKPVTGRQMFLEQRARLQSHLLISRTSDTASRYNQLGENQRKVIFILANDAARQLPGLSQLTRERLRVDFDELSHQERQSLMLGIKKLAELATALPWEFPDYIAPRLEIQALRESPTSRPKDIN